MKKQVVLWHSRWFWAMLSGSALSFVAVLIPGLLVDSSEPAASTAVIDSLSARSSGDSPLLVPVWLSRENRTEQIPLEAYVRGVVAAEMPADFELAALKAQALAARTYIIRRWAERESVPASTSQPGALVTDTVEHQAYATDAQLREQWGAGYASKMEKLTRAVRETEGLILTYGGKPINATFFSTSNGYTENSEDYWQETIPYLRSVASPWDKQLSPKYKSSVEISTKDFLTAMGVPTSIPVSSAAGMRVIDSTVGHRIKRISIGGKMFSGREVRERLNLPSSHFEWSVRAGRIMFTTYGYGHGVGMSQWGANGMALSGNTAEQIVKHYYTGIEIVSLKSVVL